jgi:MFS family permease
LNTAPLESTDSNFLFRRGSVFRALRHRNFRFFVGGQLISLCGTWMQMVAQSWLVYRLTHSAASLGAVTFTAQIPTMFLSPVAGIFADRYSRRGIVVGTQTLMMLQALALAALVLTQSIQVWHVFVLALFLGICNAFDMPTRQSFFIEMVGQDDLINAIALNSSIVHAAGSVGPAIAGILVAALGEGPCFLLNGISFSAVIAGLLLMKVQRSVARQDSSHKLEQFLDGLRYVNRKAAIRTLLLLLGINSLLSMSYVVLMPIFADQILGGGPRGLGELLTSVGLGALLCALWLAKRQRAQGLDRAIVFAAAGLGASLVLFSLSRLFWLSLLLLMPVGFFVMMQLASINTLIQCMVDNAMRGRVMGIYSMMFMGIAPFGSLLAGFLAEHLGAPAAVLISGIASLASASYFAMRRRALRIDEQLLKQKEAI